MASPCRRHGYRSGVHCARRSGLLQQPDGVSVERQDEALVRLLASETGSEVALHCFRGVLLVPPPGHLWFAQPLGRQREVGSGQPPPGQDTPQVVMSAA